MNRLERIIKEFQDIGPEFQLELLLDYAEKLPSVPPELKFSLQTAQHRVPECQTPVFLYIWQQNRRLKLIGEVPPEAPTVRGVVSILIRALDDLPLEQIEIIPSDLLQRLGLVQKIGTLRTHGIQTIVRRIQSGIDRTKIAPPDY